jgi:hypothetical protein
MTTKSIILATIVILLLAACAPATTPPPTLDINAISTAAAQTVVVGFSQTAAAVPTATQEPLPTATIEMTEAPSPTPTFGAIIAGPGTALLCDDAAYGAPLDITIPDGTQVTPGQDFLKTWKIRNTGACTWGAGYTVVFGYGEKMGGVPAAISTTVIPGQEVEVSVQFKAPTKLGEYKSWWRMANAQGSAFGKFFSVWIIVR